MTAALRRHILLPLTVLSVLAADQLSKWWVVTHMRLGESWTPVPFLDPVVTFTYVTNTGVAFGLFRGGGDIFVVVAMLAIVAVVFFYAQMELGQRLMQIALGLTVGGAMGNLLDRLIHGHVIDFVNFRVWPVFNVADSSVVVAMLVLGYYLLWQEPRQSRTE